MNNLTEEMLKNPLLPRAFSDEFYKSTHREGRVRIEYRVSRVKNIQQCLKMEFARLQNTRKIFLASTICNGIIMDYETGRQVAEYDLPPIKVIPENFYRECRDYFEQTGNMPEYIAGNSSEICAVSRDYKELKNVILDNEMFVTGESKVFRPHDGIVALFPSPEHFLCFIEGECFYDRNTHGMYAFMDGDGIIFGDCFEFLITRPGLVWRYSTGNKSEQKIPFQFRR